MTEKQFHIIRNLLSWIVITLLILVSHSFGILDNSPLEQPIGVLAAILALAFLVMIFIRSGIHCFEQDVVASKSDDQNPADPA